MAGLALPFSACVRAPIHDHQEADQVCDLNAQLAGLKDAHWQTMKNDYIDGQVQTIMDAATNAGALAPGCAVGVVESGEITYMQAYGGQEQFGPAPCLPAT